MAGQTFADDFAGRDVERGKQRRGAIALIIMGHGSGAAFLRRQARVGPVECLNLAFLVDGQHKRPLRRVEVEADDVLDLNGEVGIGRNLETFDEMRLEIVLSSRTREFPFEPIIVCKERAARGEIWTCSRPSSAQWTRGKSHFSAGRR